MRRSPKQPKMTITPMVEVRIEDVDDGDTVGAFLRWLVERYGQQPQLVRYAGGVAGGGYYSGYFAPHHEAEIRKWFTDRQAAGS